MLIDPYDLNPEGKKYYYMARYFRQSKDLVYDTDKYDFGCE